MNKTPQSIERRAKERRAEGIFEKSESLENSKFLSELGWLTALSIAIAVVAV